MTGDYVSAVGVRGSDGKMHAVELRIYPESLRGLREGQVVSNAGAGSLTTNATVANITKATDGQILGLNFKGRGADYIAGPDVPAFACVRGDAALLKPGAAIYVTAVKKPDGSLVAAQLIAEKNGIKPPF